MWRLRLGTIWMALPAALVMFTAWTMTEFPLDYWLHLVVGRWIAENGGLLSKDVFTHTIAGRDVLNYPWLAQWGMFQLHQAGGYASAQLITGVVYGAAIGLTTWTAWRRCRDTRVAAALALAAALVASTSLAVRPQAVSVLLFAASLAVLFTWRANWRSFTVLVAFEVFWTNCHGGFPLGVALPGAFLTARLMERLQAGERWRAIVDDGEIRWRFATVAACMAAMFCNPFGLMTAQYVFGVSSTASERMIGEWQPTSWSMLTGKALIAMAAIGLTAAFASRRRPEWVELLLMVPLFLIAFKSQRMAIWWALAAAPVLAPHLRSACRWWFGRPDRESPSALNAVVAAALALYLLGSTPFTRLFNPLLPGEKRSAVRGEPNQTLAFLQQADLRGRLFHPLEWGCYASWTLDANWKVFVDTRIEAFPDDVWNDYMDAAFQGRLEVLDRRRVDIVVWDLTRGDALPELLSASEKWRERYRDDIGVVFERIQTPAVNSVSNRDRDRAERDG